MFDPETTPSWEWAVHAAHRAALQAVWQEAARDQTVVGLLVCGSVARGDALPGSDLDIRVLLAPTSEPRPFDAQMLAGVWVERTYGTYEAARERLETRPMEVFPYLEGRILRDENNQLAALISLAHQRWNEYTAPEKEKKEMHYWLQATHRKIASARDAGQMGKAAYVATTSAWPILTGLFLAANRPLPPSGAVIAHLPDTAHRVELAEEIVSDLWVAPTVEGRINAALVVLETILPQLV